MLCGRFANDETRRDAFGATAELSWLLGWKHHDLAQEGAAQRYYLLGFKLAVEADPHAHAAWMMRAVAHQALSVKQRHHCLDLTRAALERAEGYADGATEALLHITHARAFAALGEKPQAARALLAAEDALGRVGKPQPTYSLLMGPAAGTVDSHTARTLTEIGDHPGTEMRHRAAFTSWNPAAFPRVHLLTHMDLGDCLAAQGRADEAVSAWGRRWIWPRGWPRHEADRRWPPSGLLLPFTVAVVFPVRRCWSTGSSEHPSEAERIQP